MKPHPFPRYRPLATAAPLVWETDQGTLKLERRRERRQPADGVVSASFSDGACRFGITAATMCDVSDSGLAIETLSPITPGMRVQIRPESAGTPWLSALAVRCEPRGSGYRIGLRLAHRPAA